MIVSAALIDRDFGEAVRILVPHGRAGSDVRKSGRANERCCSDLHHVVVRPGLSACSRHGIAEPIGVNDLCQIQRPIETYGCR